MHLFTLVVLFLTSLSILSADSSYIKMKTILNKGVYDAKFMIPRNQIIERGRKVQYMSHIVADINNKEIFDVWTGPLVSRSIRFKFKFKYSGKSDTVNLSVYNNYNKLEKRTFKLNDSNFTAIHKSSKLALDDTKKIPNRVWKTSTVDEGIKELYGEHTKFEKGIEVKIPDVISVTYLNHITIKSNIDLESIAVFAESNSKKPLRAIFTIPEDGIIDYKFSIIIESEECEKNTEVTVIGKSRDNIMYKTVSSARYCACEFACLDHWK